MTIILLEVTLVVPCCKQFGHLVFALVEEMMFNGAASPEVFPLASCPDVWNSWWGGCSVNCNGYLVCFLRSSVRVGCTCGDI